MAIEALNRDETNELFAEIDALVPHLSARAHTLWLRHRASIRASLRGAHTSTGRLVIAPEPDPTLIPLSNAALHAARAAQHAQQALDFIGEGQQARREERRKATTGTMPVVAVPEGEEPPK